MLLAALPAFDLAWSQQSRGPSAQTGDRGRERLIRQIHHELVMLPYYGVFDNLSFRADGSRMTLLGQVTRPTLKTSAERVVKDIEGVEAIDNQIEVLPVSPNDDRIRMAAYRAIYSKPALQRYGLQAVPPIHILVKNGNVVLEGVVANEGDKNIANIQARGVFGSLRCCQPPTRMRSCGCPLVKQSSNFRKPHGKIKRQTAIRIKRCRFVSALPKISRVVKGPRS